MLQSWSQAAAAAGPAAPRPARQSGRGAAAAGHLLSEREWDAIARRLGLSARESQVVSRLFAEEPDRAIARGLGISTHTVRTHMERLFRKLGVRSRVGVVVAVHQEAMRLAVREAATERSRASDAAGATATQARTLTRPA